MNNASEASERKSPMRRIVGGRHERAMDVMRVFNTLGEAILRSWKKVDYDEKRFPVVAGNALREAALERCVDVNALIAIVLLGAADGTLHQDAGRFGDLRCVVYGHPRFYIEAFVWGTGTTAIHDHSLSGAFCLVGGGSINSVYRFTEWERINSRFRIGTVIPVLLERLRVGDIRTINAGRSYIHSVFHIAEISGTVVVRSTLEEDALPQMVYRGGLFAVEPGLDGPYEEKIRAMAILLRYDRPEFYHALKELIGVASLEEKYVLHRHFASEWEEAPPAWREDARRNMGKYWGLFRQAARREGVIHAVTALRGRWVKLELRCLLVCLVSDFGRDAIVELMEKEWDRPFADVLDIWHSALVHDQGLADCEVSLIECMLGRPKALAGLANSVEACKHIIDSDIYRLFLLKQERLDGKVRP